MTKTITFDEHKEIHRNLHAALVDLVNDYAAVTGRKNFEGSILELIGWSSIQQTNPAPVKAEENDIVQP